MCCAVRVGCVPYVSVDLECRNEHIMPSSSELPSTGSWFDIKKATWAVVGY